jgi:hypothetical protein
MSGAIRSEASGQMEPARREKLRPNPGNEALHCATFLPNQAPMSMSDSR